MLEEQADKLEADLAALREKLRWRNMDVLGNEPPAKGTYLIAVCTESVPERAYWTGLRFLAPGGGEILGVRWWRPKSEGPEG